jgi:hypothetical protein
MKKIIITFIIFLTFVSVDSIAAFKIAVNQQNSIIATSDINTIAHHPIPIRNKNIKDKSLAIALTIVGGFFGLHSYYLGKFPKAVFQSSLFLAAFLLIQKGRNLFNNSNSSNGIEDVFGGFFFFTGGLLLMICFIWALIDFILLLAGAVNPANGVFG